MDQQRDGDPGTASQTISRRGFLGGSGALVAAGVAAGFSGFSSEGAAQASGVDPYVRRLGFAFPGTPEAGTLLGARGGGIRLDAITAGGLAVAPDPVTISFTNQMARPFFDWFTESARQKDNVPGTSVQIVAANTANQELYRLTLGRTRIAQVAWPRLAVGSTEVLRFGATLLAESASYAYVGGATLTRPWTPVSKALSSGRFRIGIQGIEAETAQVTRVDSFNQRLLPLPGSGSGSGTVSHDPLRLELPSTAAAAFFKWQADLLAGRGAERSGLLQFLSTDGATVAGQARFSGVTVHAIDVAPASAADGATVAAGSLLVSLNFRSLEIDQASFR